MQQPCPRERNSGGLWHQACLGRADHANAYLPGLLESCTNLWKRPVIDINVHGGRPYSLPIAEDRCPSLDTGLIGIHNAIFRQVKRRIAVVSNAKQEDLSVPFLDPGQRRSLAQPVVEGVPGNDRISILTPCGE